MLILYYFFCVLLVQLLRASAMSTLLSMLPLHSHYGNLQALDSGQASMEVKEVSDLFVSYTF